MRTTPDATSANIPPSVRRRRARSVLLLLLLLAAPVAAQDSNQTYVDDSPLAWQLFRQADDQVHDNVGEAVRLYQELLDEYGTKVLPVHENRADQFIATRTRVNERLRANDDALARYRLAEDTAARRLLDRGDLLALAMTRALTTPGLDAMLRLAQRELEMGHFHAAAHWLDDAGGHPDLVGDRARHHLHMLGLVAHCLGNAAEVREITMRLDTLGADDAASALRELERRDEFPHLHAGATIDDATDVVGLSELAGEPIWTRGLDNVVVRRQPGVFGGRGLGAGDAAGAPDESMLTVAPTIVDDTVYLNEGHVVHAVDIFTGVDRWQWGTVRVEEPPADEPIVDLNVVAVRGESVVTLTGHAYPSGRQYDGAVVCLNRRDGGLRWMIELDGIGGSEEHEGLFPHGSPVIADGLVYVLARKVTRQLLTSCYLVALDERTGDLVWTRHLASCGGVRSQNARPFSSLVQHRGNLYVATPVGAIARIDAGTGLVRWLRRYRTPVQATTAFGMPWEIGRPVVTRRGLLALEPQETRVTLLDLDTGDEIASFAAGRGDAWGAPRYLVGAGEFVYAVGAEVRAFMLDQLSIPLWTMPESGARRSSARLPRGRVQAAVDAVVIPTAGQILVVDPTTGGLISTVPAATSGNVVVAGAQLVQTSVDGASAYMQLSRAEAMLRRRIDDEPDNPDPALSLMRLGMRSQNLTMALDAAGLTLDAISRRGRTPDADVAHARLFDNLLEMVRDDLAATDAEAELLHGMIGSVATGPTQQIRHLLAYGDWLADHRLAAAVEAYQTILSDPALADTWHVVDDTERLAGDLAAARIAALVRTHGPQIYAPQDAWAAQRLEAIRAAGSGSAPTLTALAMEFPFAAAAVDAAIEAAGLNVAGGDPRAGFGVLSRLRDRATTRDAEARLIGPFVDFCLDAGWRTQARALLRDATRRYGAIEVTSKDGPRDAGTWHEALVAADVTLHYPKIGLIDAVAQELPGGIVPEHPNAAPIIQGRLALLYDPTEARLSCLETPDLVARWSRAMERRDPRILALDDDTIILWFRDDDIDPTVMALDARTGETRWTSDPIGRHFADPVRELQQDRGMADLMPSGAAYIPAETVPVIGHDTIYLVRRTGEALAIDRADGHIVKWTQATTLDRVYDVRLHECALVLSGMQRGTSPSGRVDLVPRIRVLDPATGADVQTITPLGDVSPRWLVVSPLGHLAYGSVAGVQAHDLLSGAVIWSNRGYAVQDSLRGWLVRDHLVVEDQGQQLRVLAMRDGIASKPLPLPGRPDWSPIDLIGVGEYRESMVTLFEKRLVMFDDRWSLLGADIIVDDRSYKQVLFGDDRFVLLNRSNTSQPRDERGRRRMKYDYRLYVLSPDGRLLGDPSAMSIYDRPIVDATLLDGWVLLGTADHTRAVPVPVAP